jgi:hypothetical protein
MIALRRQPGEGKCLSVLQETSLSSNLVKASVLWPIMSYLLYNSLSHIT